MYFEWSMTKDKYLLKLTTQSSLWLVYLPILENINFHINYVVSFYIAERAVGGGKMTYQVLYNV